MSDLGHTYGPENVACFGVFSGGCSQAKCERCGTLRVVETRTWFEDYETRTLYVRNGQAVAQQPACIG